MLNNKIKEYSPFTPGTPVPIEYFTARSEEIEELKRAIRGAIHYNRNDNIFITGDRGIGKTSLAKYIRNIAIKEFGFLGLHSSLRGIDKLEDMVRIVFQNLFSEQEVDQTLFDKFKKLFSTYIKSIQVGSLGVEFTNDREQLGSLVDNFIPAIFSIYKAIRETKNGIILIIDDINGIVNDPMFAPFIKCIVDMLPDSKFAFPFVLVLIGYEERRQEIIKHHLSTARIFKVINLTPLSKNESEEFFLKTLKNQNIEVEEQILKMMVASSGGYPMLMQEVGDAIYWMDTDNIINEKDFWNGLEVAARIVGEKILGVGYQILRTEQYRSIFLKMSKIKAFSKFKRKDINALLEPQEQKVFNNFLTKINKLGIVKKTEISGEYEFANLLYHFYVALEAFKAHKESK